ncbi:MAG TPA: class I SAM-dependent methyltransferase [Thermoanaerobaculia bacterium]|nr:class I SAM-dependent methyltransferase [Thermoanaerobaculia bacterium]
MAIPQYDTTKNLDARIALHQRFSTNAYGFQRWVFDRLQLAGGQRVLEAGCGTRSLWIENEERMPKLRLMLTDASIAMRPHLVCALPELPFASGAFDVAIANHMLYHVDDRERALREIKRVLRRGGLFFAATNGRDHMREVKELVPESAAVSAGFTLENGGEQVERVFPNVQREDYVDALHVTEAEPLIAYIASITKRDYRAYIESRIARDGAVHITKSTGAFFARNE